MTLRKVLLTWERSLTVDPTAHCRELWDSCLTGKDSLALLVDKLD